MDQCAKCHAKGFCRCSKALAKLRREVVLQLIPRNKLSQLDPAIVTREFATKRQEEVFKRELAMLTPIYVENSGPPLGSDRPVLTHVSSKNY